MQVARVDREEQHHHTGQSEPDLLGNCHFRFDLFSVQGAIHIDLALFVVRTEPNTLNEGALQAVVIVVVVKDLVHHVVCALCALKVHLVAHLAVGVVVRWIVL